MQQKTSLYTILLGLLLLIVIVNAIVIAGLIRRGTASSYALALTSPVYSFTGTVKSVGKDTLTVEYMPAGIPTSNVIPKAVRFTVKVTDKTAISSTPVQIPYLFRTNTLLASEGSKKEISDIVTGSTVSVTADKDLRTASNGSITASAISIQSLLSVITGKVQSASANSFVVKGVRSTVGTVALAATSNTTKETNFTISMDANTEIAKMPGVQLNPQNPVKPEKLTASDIKTNDTVTAYGYPGQNETSLNALMVRVESPLMLEIKPSTSVAPVASASGTIAPKKPGL